VLNIVIMKFLIPLIAFVVLLQSCDESPPMNPRKFILGKWELTQMGTWERMVPVDKTGYLEFSDDSVARFYNYEEDAYTSQFVYWMKDSLLMEMYPRVGDDPVVIRYRYYLEKDWTHNDRLLLEHIDFDLSNQAFEYRRTE
jgi:hypothetical protein